jgi:hypothetical protein
MTPSGSVAPYPDVEVRASTRRRKTAGAHFEGGRIVVVVPAHWPAPVRDRVVEDLVGQLAGMRPAVTSSDADLASRAADLADRYLGGVRPSSVRWVSNQTTRWGSCTTLTRSIRISDRLRTAPVWVVDAVLVHELAHLIEHAHSARFRALADRYPRMAEADVFLAGLSLGLGWSSAAAAENCTVQTV